jgi:glycosyltransferase involved in cell wall biosynthesis
MCPIGSTGYGITSYNIYKQLRDKLEICLFPIGNPSIDFETDKQNIVEDIQKQLIYDNQTTFLKIWHQYDLATRIGNGKYAALTFFEVDKLKPIEISMINNTDIIFVASNWAKQILLNNNITTKICVSPLAADQEIFNTSVAHERPKESSDKYIFLNMGKWELRKGHDVLLEAFNLAFEEKDNVELWMLSYNPFLSPEDNLKWVKLYQNSKLGNKIKILPRLPTHKDVANIISMSDCGIFPARAEGWNNEAVEMMAMNKPIILTNYSAHTEYANTNNSYLIDIDRLVPAKDNLFFDGFGNWADLSFNEIEQMVEHMRYVYKNSVNTNPVGLETAKNLTWSNTANILYNHLYG